MCALKEKIAMLLESWIGTLYANENEGVVLIIIFIYTL